MAEVEYSNQLSSDSSRYTFPLRAKAAGARMFRMMTMITPSISQAAQMGPARVYGGGGAGEKSATIGKKKDTKSTPGRGKLGRAGKTPPRLRPLKKGAQRRTAQ